MKERYTQINTGGEISLIGEDGARWQALKKKFRERRPIFRKLKPISPTLNREAAAIIYQLKRVAADVEALSDDLKKSIPKFKSNPNEMRELQKASAGFNILKKLIKTYAQEFEREAEFSDIKAHAEAKKEYLAMVKDYEAKLQVFKDEETLRDRAEMIENAKKAAKKKLEDELAAEYDKKQKEISAMKTKFRLQQSQRSGKKGDCPDLNGKKRYRNAAGKCVEGKNPNNQRT